MVLHHTKSLMHCDAVKVHTWTISRVTGFGYPDARKTLRGRHRGFTQGSNILGYLAPNCLIRRGETLTHVALIGSNFGEVYIAGLYPVLYNYGQRTTTHPSSSRRPLTEL